MTLRRTQLWLFWWATLFATVGAYCDPHLACRPPSIDEDYAFVRGCIDHASNMSSCVAGIYIASPSLVSFCPCFPCAFCCPLCLCSDLFTRLLWLISFHLCFQRFKIICLIVVLLVCGSFVSFCSCDLILNVFTRVPR